MQRKPAGEQMPRQDSGARQARGEHAERKVTEHHDNAEREQAIGGMRREMPSMSSIHGTAHNP